MVNAHQLTLETVETQIDGTTSQVSTMRREGPRAPVVFLHGFGSTKEDYGDTAFHQRFDGRQLIAYDAPGFGSTRCDDLSTISIPFLCQNANAILTHFGVDRFHLVGHSMGGLTGLQLANWLGERVISFTNIEGNIAPEDCFLSRQIIEHPAENAEAFLETFARRAFSSHSFSYPLYASTLIHKVRAGATAPIFRSMVEISDTQPLLDQFITLPCARMFVYGDENHHLSYLSTLLKRGVQLAEIENCGHFPMYANPTALWQRIGQFLDQAEMVGTNA